MKQIQGVFKNGRVELLETISAPENTKLMILVTDEQLPASVAPEVAEADVIEKIRIRTHTEFSDEQQVKSREKLKQAASKIGQKLPFHSLEQALNRSLGDNT